MRPVNALVTALLTLSLLTAGCGSEDVDSSSTTDEASGEAPDREPDLSGTVTSIIPLVPEDGDVLGTILVEGDVAPERGRKISYTVTPDTKITGTSGDGTGVGVFAELAEGQLADTWATGPCAESYPEQCTLEAIRITG